MLCLGNDQFECDTEARVCEEGKAPRKLRHDCLPYIHCSCPRTNQIHVTFTNITRVRHTGLIYIWRTKFCLSIDLVLVSEKVPQPVALVVGQYNSCLGREERTARGPPVFLDPGDVGECPGQDKENLGAFRCSVGGREPSGLLELWSRRVLIGHRAGCRVRGVDAARG